MNILIIGNGGREHALAWKAAQSKKVTQVFVAPGNGGTATEAKVKNVDISIMDFAKLIEFAKDNAIAYTIVGPEAPLAAGISDAFAIAGLKCFGPSQKAAKLEASKQFAKNFMEKYNIPTAKFASFTEAAKAKVYVKMESLPIVIKADGLAAGKGVVIANTQAKAFAVIDAMLEDKRFGEAGQRIVIEEFLQGEEASFIVATDGEHVLPFVSSQDHKARDDGDAGPNTGGMGAYSPAPIISTELQNQIMEEIIYPTINGLREEKIQYQGFLYAGIMINLEGEPKVLEYNCRLGDPETQVIMMRLESDLIELCETVFNHDLQHYQMQWTTHPALGVVLAAGGYPDNYNKGDEISGLENINLEPINGDHVKVFHAGTLLQDNKIITNGGRVLCVCALGEHIKTAQHNAYNTVNKIQWQGMFHRHDIGYRAIVREEKINQEI